MRKVNWPIVALGVLWWALETRYFGWNRYPGSVAELFADGMGLAFFALAFAFPKRGVEIHVTMKDNDNG